MNTERTLLHRACAAALAIGAAFLALPQSVSAQASAATLGHRYTFNSDTITTTNEVIDNGDGTFTTNATVTSVADVIGGLAWAGSLTNGGDFTNVVTASGTTNGEVTLTSGSHQFVQLPAGIISNYMAITVDMWCTLPQFGSEWGFLFDFGNTDTNTADWYVGDGGNCIFLSPPARLCISDTMPSWGGEENASFPNLGNTFPGIPIHLTCVIDPPRQRLLVYTNGSLAGVNYAETWALASVYCIDNYIAKSLYNGDAYVDVTVDEYRIWIGALNGLEVAGCDLAGPDNTTPSSVGTVTNITMQIPSTNVVLGTRESPTISGLATLFTNVLNIDPYLCTYSSGNTSILKVDTNGLVTAVGVGTASITASYGSGSSSVSITVYPPPLTLGHRYSFNGDLTDSVGGSAWDGSLPNGGTSTSSNVMLQSADPDYVVFPAGMISNYWAVTVDCWATFPTTLSGNMFLWCFGEINGSVGGHYIFLQPAAGRIAIGGNDAGYQGEETCYGMGNLGLQTNVHLTAVFDPVAGYMAAFLNGQLVGQNTNVTFPMSSISSADNFIARSLYSGDLYVDVNMDEYRVFEGVLSPQEIAVADQAGPSAVPGAITNGPGSVVGFNVLATNRLEWLEASPVKVLVNYQHLTNWDIVANSLTPPTNLIVTTSDTNILTITGDGKVLGRNPGTANVIVSFQSVTTNLSVTVTRSAPTAAVAHRYSFNETSGSTVADSVGGSAWDGTLPNGGAFGGGQLSLLGSSQQYVNLPAGVIDTNTMTAVTIEAWATFPAALPWNACFFSIGDVTGSLGRYYIFSGSQGGRINIAGIDPGYMGEQNAYSGMDWSGKTLHITGVINPPLGYIAIYTNGVLAGVNGSETWPLSSVVDNYSYINRSLYSGDPYLNLTINEFRIYGGALSPEDVAQTDLLGPDVLLTPQLSAAVVSGNVVVSWPINFSGFTLKSSGSLGGSASWNAVGTTPVISGWNYQVALPTTNSAQFFRLSN